MAEPSAPIAFFYSLRADSTRGNVACNSEIAGSIAELAMQIDQCMPSSFPMDIALYFGKKEKNFLPRRRYSLVPRVDRRDIDLRGVSVGGCSSNPCRAGCHRTGPEAPAWLLGSIRGLALHGDDLAMDYRLEDDDRDFLTPAHWRLEKLAADLRTLRSEWRQATKPAGVIYELPSREAMAEILDGLAAALFPRHFGPPTLSEERVDAFVRRALDQSLHALLEQVRRELRLTCGLTGSRRDRSLDWQAEEITQSFSLHVPKVRALLESDLQAAFRGDPAARSLDEVLLCYPGILAITRHRLAHALYSLGAPLLARFIAEISHSATGIDIHPGADIGSSFFIDHGTGVVIGETAVIGRNVRLYQAVTLGAKRFQRDENGDLVKGGARHPLIEDDVVIYAGATILGRITIGRGSSIGGNVWLTHSVPPGSHITQAQSRNDVFIDGGGI